MHQSQWKEKEAVIIEQVECGEAIKYLGVNIAADGNMDKEWEVRKNQAREFGDKIYRSNLSRRRL